jgi:hypothetical protein
MQATHNTRRRADSITFYQHGGAEIAQADLASLSPPAVEQKQAKNKKQLKKNPNNTPHHNTTPLN